MRKVLIFPLVVILLASCFQADQNSIQDTNDLLEARNNSNGEILIFESESETETESEPLTISFGGKGLYSQIFFEDFESYVVDDYQGIILFPDGEDLITSDPSQVLDGRASALISENRIITSDSQKYSLLGNSRYLIQFDYLILHRGNSNEILEIRFYPEGSDKNEDSLSTFGILKNAETTGTFTGGTQTGSASNYYFTLHTKMGASIVIDNLKIIRIDVHSIDEQPDHWSDISQLPFPRLGNYAFAFTNWMAYGMAGEPSFSYSVNQIERRLAMFDVIAGLEVNNQSIDPGLTYRLRSLNPDIIILPYSFSNEHEIAEKPLFDNATLDIYYNLQLGLAEEWIVDDVAGIPVEDPHWPGILKMNTSEFSPEVGGLTFNEYLINHVLNTVIASGIWDGIFFDNLFGKINPHIPNAFDPGSLDFDINLNGERDETIAYISEITRLAMIELVKNIREEVGNREIIMGNAGPQPNIYMAPYVNGYTFECVNHNWDSDEWVPNLSEPNWRLTLDSYFLLQSENYEPATNIFQGCGRTGSILAAEGEFLVPTKKDIADHRFTLGTALLGDGFYEYDLFDARSVPYWFDEYTVNENGEAVEDPKYKGFLGMPLGPAVELASPATVVLEEYFEGGYPSSFYYSDSVYVSNDPGDTIQESSLIINNPDHTQWHVLTFATNPTMLKLKPEVTYLINFDWRILESLDGWLMANIGNGETVSPFYEVQGVVTGDTGTAVFPFTPVSGEDLSFNLQLFGGGGKVSIDNLTITEGGAGPWRRDFENGFVLVNPLNKTYNFNLEELTGPFSRTGIKRILGTQAPEINNGMPVTESLTLKPFDAILLLADYIPAD